jgi:SAM-dependent methyltransferase
MITDQSYADKPQEYFAGIRRDIIDRLSVDRQRRILEIGCGDGSTGDYAKKNGKCGTYIGVELFNAAAKAAERVIDKVHVGNIENLELPYPDHHFDVLIASEVLEHLIDPWEVLRSLHRKMKVGGRVYASSPNIAHHSTLRMLVSGRWDLESSGRMDRTHLRWFTPKSYAEMFEQTGYSILSIEPLVQPGFRARIFDLLTFKQLSHLFISQVFITASVKQA